MVEIKNLVTYETLVHAIAGASGGVIGIAALYPLEIIKLRSIIKTNNTPIQDENVSILKQLEKVLKNEGIAALYQGLDPMVKSLYLSNFVYFYTYNALKSIQKDNTSSSVFNDLFLSSIAGVVNVLSTTPFWVVNTRLKLSNQYKGLFHGIEKIYKEEGLLALWKGTFASLILVSNPAIHMTVYELLKRYLNNVEDSSLKFFLLASMSKIVSTLITYPVQIAQNVQRVSQNTATDRESNKGKPTPETMIEILIYIFKYEGIRGLYRGVEAKIYQTVLTAALMFVMYEKIVTFVFKTFQLKRRV